MVSDITFGENLKRLRKRAKLTQNDVAEALNISRILKAKIILHIMVAK